jgi:hypothetical protein
MKIRGLNLIAGVGAVIALGLAPMGAQSIHTNLVLTATLNLTAYVQQPTNSSGSLPAVAVQRFANKDIISAIETHLGFPTTDLSTARLLVQFVGLGNTNQQSSLNIVLRTASGDTNLNDLVSLDFPSFLTLLNNEVVKTSRPNINGTETRTEYSIASLSLDATDLLTFHTQGRVKITESSVLVNGKILDKRLFPLSYSFTLAGSGTVGTNQAVFNGTAAITGRKIETAPNLPPAITILSPTNNQTFSSSTNIIIQARATDFDGGVTLVEFFQEDLKLGEASNAPYSFTWTNAPLGSSTITAKATDTDDATTTSVPVSISVASP